MRQISIRMDEELLDAIDAVRGDVPRERWVRGACWQEISHEKHKARALESALAGSGAPAEVAPSREARPPSSAPTRPPAKQARMSKIEPSATDAYLRSVQKRAASRPSVGTIVSCPDCGKANGVHKGDCPNHPRNKR